MKLAIFGALCLCLLLISSSVRAQENGLDSVTWSGKIGNAVIVSDSKKGKWVCMSGFSPGANGFLPWRCSAGWRPVEGAWSIDIVGRLDLTNQKLDGLLSAVNESTKASNESRAALERIATTMSDAIQQIVAKRFETLPGELMNDPIVKAKLEQLKKEIMKDVNDLFPPK
ncbi:MAG: hypothetical protein WBO10_03095 [Pyrinomonadaceae bacterium]